MCSASVRIIRGAMAPMAAACFWCLCLLTIAPVVVDAYTAYSVCDRFANGDCEPFSPFGLNGTLRVAVAQTASNISATIEQNAEKLASWIDRSAKESARIVVFPELALTGYFANSVLALSGPSGSRKIANARIKAAEDIVAQACKRNQIYALFGTPVYFDNVNASGNPSCTGQPPQRCERPWFNTALLVDPQGKKIYRQAKLYPCCEQVGSMQCLLLLNIIVIVIFLLST